MLLRPPGVASDGLFLFYIRAKNIEQARSEERVQGTKFLAGVWGLESRARRAGFSVTEIGNRKERLRDYASFPDDFDLPRSKVATGLLPFAWDAPPR